MTSPEEKLISTFLGQEPNDEGVVDPARTRMWSYQWAGLRYDWLLCLDDQKLISISVCSLADGKMSYISEGYARFDEVIMDENYSTDDSTWLVFYDDRYQYSEEKGIALAVGMHSNGACQLSQYQPEPRR